MSDVWDDAIGVLKKGMASHCSLSNLCSYFERERDVPFLSFCLDQSLCAYMKNSKFFKLSVSRYLLPWWCSANYIKSSEDCTLLCLTLNNLKKVILTSQTFPI